MGYAMADNGSAGRVGISEAAKRLGMTPAAVRKRVHRGTLPAEKGEDGNWYVQIDAVPADDPTPAAAGPDRRSPQDIPLGMTAYDDLVATLKSEVSFLRSELEQRNHELESRSEELRRKDYLIAQFAQRLPELPAPAVPVNDGPSDHEANGAPPRPWWKFWVAE